MLLYCLNDTHGKEQNLAYTAAQREQERRTTVILPVQWLAGGWNSSQGHVRCFCQNHITSELKGHCISCITSWFAGATKHQWSRHKPQTVKCEWRMQTLILDLKFLTSIMSQQHSHYCKLKIYTTHNAVWQLLFFSFWLEYIFQFSNY